MTTTERVPEGSEDSSRRVILWFTSMHTAIPPWQGLKDTVLKSPGDPLSMGHWQDRM